MANTAQNWEFLTQNSRTSFSSTCLVSRYIWQSDILKAKPRFVFKHTPNSENSPNKKKKCCTYTSMKAYRDWRGTASLILNFWTRYSCQPQVLATLLLRKESPTVISELEVVRVPELDGTFWRQEKSLAPAKNQTTDHPACRLVTIPLHHHYTVPSPKKLSPEVSTKILQRLLVPFHISFSAEMATVPTGNPEALISFHIQF